MSEFSFRRLLTPSRVAADQFFRSDWTLNLYRGCNHGCVYCDSRSVCYHMEDFDRIRVKKDCLAALETELRTKKNAGVVSVGAASDPYNALEADLRVTQGALILLRRYGFGLFLSTKSALIARDAAYLGELARQGYCCAALSITTGDEGLASLLEPGAAGPARRFSAMAALAAAGVCTGTWINPMLPFLTDTEANLRDLLARTADAGGKFAMCHFGVTLREGDREYFYGALDAHPRFAGVKAKYINAFGLAYGCAAPEAERLSAVFDEECDRLHLAHTFTAINRAAAIGEPVQTSLW